ncbi:MAG: ABC transporter permease [Cardiobacteriaceae bacterium]|nr:ABC transporter permease [Cardiobacteriaceae bacterium]
MHGKKAIFYYSISFFTVAIIIIIWSLISYCNLMEDIVLPSPMMVLFAFIDLIVNGYRGSSLWCHWGVSLIRIIVSLILAIIIAVPLGLLTGLNKTIHAIFNPFINFLKPLPPLGYYSILILWCGIGELSKISLLFLSAVVPLFLATNNAVAKIPQDFILSAKISGANKKELFYKVIFPYCLTDIFLGIRLALGASYSTLVAAEMVAAKSGIGWLVLDASKFVKTDVVFVGVVLIGLTGLVLDYLLVTIKNKIVFWDGK